MATVLLLQSTTIAGKNAGDPVDTWADDSGNGFNASASGAARPTYQVDANSIPYLSFDGTDDAMNAGTLGAWGGVGNGQAEMQAGCTLFAVFKCADTSNNRTLFGDNAYASSSGFGLALNGNLFSSVTANGILASWCQGSSRGFQGAPSTFTPCDGALHVVAVRCDGMVNGVVPNGKFWLDGADTGTVASSRSSFSTFQSWAINAAGLAIGANSIAGALSRFFLGSLYHVEIQDDDLADVDVASRITALTSQYTSAASLIKPMAAGVIPGGVTGPAYGF